MKSIIVGTAGHIDHGKTALVKALTGIDADRLEEEKRRGITIDLGFAHMDLPAASDVAKNGLAKNASTKSGETLRIGFVDVPGHERFVRNMLAGVGGIDLVLLVIAADEGIKPQTREHFDILQLLGVRRGITVLTKSDAVDAETLEVVRMEVQEFLRGSFLEGQPVVAVSSLTGAGLEELKRAMVAAAAEVLVRDSQALARLPIDRVFTMKGFGTVVTGTLISGTIRREDELEVFPTGRRVRVRGVQVHGEATDVAMAGQRTALNLAGASTEDLARGMTLAPVDTFVTTQRADVTLRLLASAARPLKNRSRVHFHSHTMETVAEVVLYGFGAKTPTSRAKDAREMGHPLLHETEAKIPTLPKEGARVRHPQFSPGEEGFARIKLAEPALLLPGDRFIIRQFSPVVTIGGGVVLDVAPVSRLSQDEDFLSILADGDRESMLRMRILRHAYMGVSLSQLIADSGLGKSAIEAALSRAVQNGEILRIGDRLLHAGHLASLQQRMLRVIGDFQRQNPLENGITRERLRENLKAADSVFDRALEDLDRERMIAIAGELVRLPGLGVVMKDEEAEAKKKIEEAFAAAGLKVPALQEVIAGLKIDKARAQKIVTLLLRDRVLVKISDELVFHRGALEQLRRDLAGYKTKSARIDVAKFKELSGVSRKYAIPLLEYLDRERVTRRVGDVREIL